MRGAMDEACQIQAGKRSDINVLLETIIRLAVVYVTFYQLPSGGLYIVCLIQRHRSRLYDRLPLRQNEKSSSAVLVGDSQTMLMR